MGADYQHAVRPIWTPASIPDPIPTTGGTSDPVVPPASLKVPLLSRIEVFTGRRPDVSAMLGFVGQHGWTRKFDGKSNAFRDNASPCIYVSPSLNGHAQIIFNLDTQTVQYVWSVSLTDDPDACAALLAASAFRRPRGAYGSPSQEDYSTQLRRMLLPHAIAPQDGHIMVRHDPITGMPDSTYILYPVIYGFMPKYSTLR